MPDVSDRLRGLIKESGPIRFSVFQEVALYDKHDSFYAKCKGAGRHRDFITSPELGDLFASVICTALDTWWENLGRPDPFVVIEAGAGSGTLARSILSSDLRCRPAMKYVTVERSDQLRAQQKETLTAFSVDILGEFPKPADHGVVIANELLDNLPVDLFQLDRDRWQEVRVSIDGDGGFQECLVAAQEPDVVELWHMHADDWPEACRVSLQRAAGEWLSVALGVINQGRVLCFDYMSTTTEMAHRDWTDWLRTYSSHSPGHHPLYHPGTQDITCEVAIDQLTAVHAPTLLMSQAEFLKTYGLDNRVQEARETLQQTVATGGLEALHARNLLQQATALTDSDGLGGFKVAVFESI